MIERTWAEVMTEIVERAKAKSRARYERAMRDRAFDLIRNRKMVETTAEDFLNVLRAGKKSANHFLRRLHNLALGLGWLPTPVLAPKLWPAVVAKVRRGITRVEHELIIKSEKNDERRLYYELLWETGGSQTDIVNLRAANILWDQKIICYSRCKLKPDAIALPRQSHPAAGGFTGPREGDEMPQVGGLHHHYLRQAASTTHRPTVGGEAALVPTKC
jgi:hypothetical protein